MQIRKRKQNSKRHTESKLVFDSNAMDKVRCITIHSYDKTIDIICLSNDGHDTYRINLQASELILLKESIEHSLTTNISKTFIVQG